jgi:hypothetical protein
VEGGGEAEEVGGGEGVEGGPGAKVLELVFTLPMEAVMFPLRVGSPTAPLTVTHSHTCCPQLLGFVLVTQM